MTEGVVDRDFTPREFGASCAWPMRELPGYPGAWLLELPVQRLRRSRIDGDGRIVQIDEWHCTEVLCADAQEEHEDARRLLEKTGFETFERWTDGEGLPWVRYRRVRKWIERSEG